MFSSRRLALSLVLAVSTLQSACGLLRKASDDVTGGSGGIGDRERANYAAWKANPRKACSTAAAFEGKTDGENVGIDAQTFLQQTGGSLAVRDAAGGFLLLGSGYDLTGYTRSSLGRQLTVNGGKKAFEAEMERQGSRCVVKLDGKQVYETEILASVPVLAFGRGAIAAPVTTPAYIRTQAWGLESHGLLEAVFGGSVRAAELDAELVALLPFTATWSKAERERLFPVQRLGGRHVAFFPPEAGLVPFNSEHPALTGVEASWTALAQATGETSFELYVTPPLFARDGFGNKADTGLWHLAATVAWETPSGSSLPNYKLTSLTLADAVPFDGARMAACMQQRQTAFASTGLYGTDAYSPHFDGVIGACAALAADSDRALYEIPEARALVTLHFSGVTGKPGVGYGGWDGGLAALARQAVARNEGVAAALDPTGASPLIAHLDRYAQAIVAGTAERPTLLEKTATYVDTFGLTWALRGEDVDVALIDRFLAAFERAMLPFPESVDAWVSDVASKPTAPEQATRADYALALTDETIAAVLELRRVALAAGLDGAFANAKLDDVIQAATPVDALLPTWSLTIAALADFKKRDLLRAEGESQFSFESNFLDLAGRGIKEDWVEADLVNVETIAAVASYDEFCKLHADVSTLFACKNASAFTREAKGFLAPERAAAYVALAGELGQTLKGLEGGSDWSLKLDLIRSFFEPVWKSCDAGGINANRETLKGLLTQRKNAETFARFELDRKISDLLDACR